MRLSICVLGTHAQSLFELPPKSVNNEIVKSEIKSTKYYKIESLSWQLNQKVMHQPLLLPPDRHAVSWNLVFCSTSRFSGLISCIMLSLTSAVHIHCLL